MIAYAPLPEPGTVEALLVDLFGAASEHLLWMDALWLPVSSEHLAAASRFVQWLTACEAAAVAARCDSREHCSGGEYSHNACAACGADFGDIARGDAS